MATAVDTDNQVNRNHKKTKVGRGGREKKKEKRDAKAGNLKERHNPRAFSVSNIVRTQRNIQRNLDRAQKKEYVPLSDRRAARIESGPPPLVAVVGPPKVVSSCSLSEMFFYFPSSYKSTSLTSQVNV